MLFADDMVICGKDVMDLQNSFDLLHDYAVYPAYINCLL